MEIKINKAGKLEITLDKDTKAALFNARLGGEESIGVDYDSENFEAHQDTQSIFVIDTAWLDCLTDAVGPLVDDIEMDCIDISGLCGQFGPITVTSRIVHVTVNGIRFDVTHLSSMGTDDSATFDPA
jgi:hypothetical protein